MPNWGGFLFRKNLCHAKAASRPTPPLFPDFAPKKKKKKNVFKEIRPKQDIKRDSCLFQDFSGHFGFRCQTRISGQNLKCGNCGELRGTAGNCGELRGKLRGTAGNCGELRGTAGKLRGNCGQRHALDRHTAWGSFWPIGGL